nr:Sulfotransferase domain protein [Virgibacillus halodenitrificans]
MGEGGVQKFAIVGQGRCGSNLLKFSLKQNYAISVIGELFNKNVYDDVFDLEGACRARNFYEAELEKPFVTAAGFKLFAHQATKKPAKSVWKYLIEKNIKIIHLERRNKVDRIVSLEVASATGSFLKRSENDAYSMYQLDFPATWWRDRIKQDYEVESRLSERFSNNAYLHIYYEDLVENWFKVTEEIQKFLEVPVQKIEKAIEKQEFKLKKDRLKNYDELISEFEADEFAWMFE